jgi:hypothetical protein
MDMGIADILPDNCLKQAQNNTVVSSQEKMDRVGVEPTTSAQKQLYKAIHCISKGGAMERKPNCSNHIRYTLFILFECSL